ncbi:hypothetical protein SODALDRAFT_19325 [Sodiomyces alkalinus F11]|uniref:NAD dependent epimerase/dehydratase n=1 Tax=Sodiomyces alkalinus (strain CBS 110278 / VKM F-3762 / F11) TaxID=1314773 RepID=A0A3N2Q757_SODAK|nr:hypothetical protein SODALDRAFT_19325 [Sodiomyces alkalinus F11]ROT42619.1 hypothetical protein SODALDRAFT_19325 [Sodiomyces alkalinus F11]
MEKMEKMTTRSEPTTTEKNEAMPHQPGMGTRTHPMKVLSLGLPRMGSYSMCLALQQLGYQNVYHLIDDTARRPEDWDFFAEAADALFPSLPTYNKRGMTREQWDVIFGSCEGITDIGSIFAKSLIEAYPEAKVILVERDFDSWWKSMENLLDLIFGRTACLYRDVIEPVAESGLTKSVQKVVGGWLGVETLNPSMAELRARVRDVYAKHNAMIPKLVPEERLLRCQLGEGWGPLCKFLDKKVPDTTFPHANDAASFKKQVQGSRTKLAWLALQRVAFWVSAIMVVGVMILLAGRMQGY